MKECGMDALCYVRVLKMGYKIALMGCLNAIWLLPVYATAPDDNDPQTPPITDRIVETTLGHVPAGSPRLVATSLASWVLFGYTMYLILQELEWFADKRHKFLIQPRPRNYSVYVSDIPTDLQRGPELRDFFRDCFSYEAVLGAQLRLHATNVSRLVGQRESVILKLEHAVAEQEATGKTPMHSLSLKDSLLATANAVGGNANNGKVESIPTYAEELKELNGLISQSITGIEDSQRGKGFKDMADSISQSMLHVDKTESMSLAGAGASDSNNGWGTSDKAVVPENAMEEGEIQVDAQSHDDISTLASRPQTGKDLQDTNHSGKSENSSNKLVQGSSKLFKSVVNSAAAVGDGALGVLKGSEDGEPYSAGFVTFSNLRTATAAKQLLHHQTPHVLKVQEAPDPEDIFWFNVGRKNRELQVGRLLSMAATTALCLLWTIPVAFVASLSSVDALREKVDFIDDLLNSAPFLVSVFEVGAPLLLVIFNAMLPIILEIFSMLEGPVSGAVVEASLFSKLAYFMIIQTFFVSALSGSVMEVSTL